MSIETTGPRAYEYQYIATLWMTLRFFDKEEENVFVENKGFEDALLTYSWGETECFIDIQVKERNEDIALDEFCKWLAHFEKRKTDSFLLKRIKQENHRVVFITNNRSTDKVSNFLKSPEARKRLNKEEILEIKQNILDSIDRKSGINGIRYNVLNEFLGNITDSDFRAILDNVSIIENFTTDIVKDKIFKILKVNYYIPEVMCEDVVNQMLDVVRGGRDTGENIVCKIKEIIKANCMQRILPEDDKYYEREILQTLATKLDDEPVLLLTGVPFSGKTYLAKTIAQIHLERGYFIKRTDSLVKNDEAYNFLWSKENDSRLLLVEDPFGCMQMKEENLHEWDRLNKLIEECVSVNRKIIVTSRKDILLEVCKKSHIRECCIRKYEWNNVDVNSINEAKKVWEKYYGESEESHNIFNRLKIFFDQQDIKPFLEIGEIAYLYTEVPNVLELVEMNAEQIVQIASLSIEEICRKIQTYNSEYVELFMLLGGLCNTIRTVSIKDFAYIFYGENHKPSIRKNEEPYATVTLGGMDEDDKNKKSFPIYDKQYELQPKERNILREFCNKGYIYRDKVTKELSYKHPLYHYVSVVLLKRELEEDWENEKWVEYFNKAIGSLSRNAALCALDTLMKYFDQNQLILECFVDGSNSIFPAVRDMAVSLLDKQFDDLDEKMQLEFINNITRNKTADKYLNWDDDECWYQLSNSYHHSFSLGWEMLGLGSKLIDIIEQKISNGEEITKQETYKILHSNYASKLPLEFLEDAFLKEEAIIRSKAIYYIFSIYGDKVIESQTKYLKPFENYIVVYEIIKGTLSNWENFSQENRKIILNYLQEQLQRKSVSIIVKDFLENFGDEYRYDFMVWQECSEETKKELWKAWAELFACWLNCFPVKFISAHEPHMVSTTDRSLEYLSNEPECIVVADAWMNWLKEYMKYHSANDYGMSVMEYLIKGTADKPSLRGGMIEKILEEKDTNIITSHFSNLITNWEMLCNEEKDLLCTFLSEKNRIDYKWLQAICLVQKNVPEEVQIAVCGKNILDQESATIVEDLLQMEILEECLSIYCGFPQPLWWNGYHHRAVAKWDKVITEVLKNGKFDQSYYIAIREFVETLYRHETHRFKHENCFYEQILKSEMARKKVFERLAYCVTFNDDHKEMWDSLLKASTEKEKIWYFGIINDYIELFEYKNIGHAGLLKEFDMKNIRKYILPNFEKDETIIEFCEWVMYMCQNKCFIKEINISYEHGNSIEVDVEKEAEVKQKLKEVIIKSYQDGEIHLLFTGNFVEFSMRKLNVEFPEFELILEKHKKEFWNRHDMVKKRFEENCPLDIVDFYPLKNWCHTEKCM